jgi:hypothetical protein
MRKRRMNSWVASVMISPGDLALIFEAILANAVRLCEAKFGNLFLHEGGALRIVASHDVPAEFVEARRRRAAELNFGRIAELQRRHCHHDPWHFAELAK